VKKVELEGVIAKRADTIYQSGKRTGSATAISRPNSMLKHLFLLSNKLSILV